eukprot:61687-Amphidinium_carterae.3
MIPVPQPLLVTLASFDHDAARCMFSRKPPPKVENYKYVTGLDHMLDPNDPKPICIVLEPFHDRDFPNGVEFQWGDSANDCFKLSKSITSNSRKYRGPADGWIKIEDFDYSFRAWDSRLLLLSCCYGKKPRIELMITSNTRPRANNDLDIIILKVRAIQGFFTANRGEESMDLDTTATLCNPVTRDLGGRFGHHTTETEIEDFQRSGIIPGGAQCRMGLEQLAQRPRHHQRVCAHDPSGANASTSSWKFGRAN